MVQTSAPESGLIELTPEHVEELPDGPGVFQLVSPGQKVIYVGHGGEKGVRESLWEIIEEQAITGVGFFRYQIAADPAAAEELAARYVEELKPTYNLGYGRFRNSEVTRSRQGRTVRRAAPNP